MKRIIDAIKGEPVRTIQAVVAIIGVLASFGIDLTPDQQAAIISFLVVALPGAGEVARRFVRPERDVQQNFRPRDLVGK